MSESTAQHSKKVGQVTSPNGREFSCCMARHLCCPAVNSLYEGMARLTRLSEKERENRELYEEDPTISPDDLERGLYTGSQQTLAEAQGMSINWVKKYLPVLVEAGAVIPTQRERDERGRLKRTNYEVVTHFEYALRHGCPACRFDSDGKVKEPRKPRELGQNFGARVDGVELVCT